MAAYTVGMSDRTARPGAVLILFTHLQRMQLLVVLFQQLPPLSLLLCKSFV